MHPPHLEPALSSLSGPGLHELLAPPNLSIPDLTMSPWITQGDAPLPQVTQF